MNCVKRFLAATLFGVVALADSDQLDFPAILNKDMIDMSVRDQNGVAAINAGAQTLLAMVGWNIDQDHARLAGGVGEL